MTGGKVYTAFSRDRNVSKLELDPRLPLQWSLDFNVDPLCSVVMQMDGETAKVIDEIVLRHASTQQACEEFVNRYGRHRAKVQVLGDASGHQQRTTGNTDYAIIQEYLRAYTNLEVEHLARRSNPSVRDRVVLVNRLLRSASGVTRVVVDEKCEELLKDFEQVAFKEDTFNIDKDRDRMRTHISDALGYVLWEKFEPMGTIGECTVRML
jgi:hypothetical protein